MQQQILKGTVVQSFESRNKRNLEDDLEVSRRQNLLPASDPNKRRKLIKVLGEDGLEQGGIVADHKADIGKYVCIEDET